MNRTDLAAIAARLGIKPGVQMTAQQRTALRVAIAAALTSDALAAAPRIFDGSGGRPMTLKDATEALIEELGG